MLWAGVAKIGEFASSAIDDDEAALAATFATPLRRRQFLAGRGLLRRMLARAFGQRPEDWVFDPRVGAPPRVRIRPDLHLSVSHRGEWVAAAISNRPIGIDLETLGARRNPERLARWVCSRDELAVWRALTGSDADEALLAHWTRKEAWLKREGGRVRLTRMRGLQADPCSAALADVATWRFDPVIVSLCASQVREAEWLDGLGRALQPIGTFRIREIGVATPSPASGY